MRLLFLILLGVVGMLAQAPAVSSDYRIAAGDTVDIRFFYNSELNVTGVVRPDGKISMPLVGEVPVADISVAEAVKKLESLYSDTVKRTSVTVQVTNFANRRVFVGGEVNRPGMLPLPGEQTVLGALLEAGGLRGTARQSDVLLIRRDSQGKPQVTRVTIRADKGSTPEAAGLVLQPFDVVLAVESRIARANRFVDQYVRQMSPFLLTFGFDYLLNAGGFNAPQAVVR